MVTDATLDRKGRASSSLEPPGAGNPADDCDA